MRYSFQLASWVVLMPLRAPAQSLLVGWFYDDTGPRLYIVIWSCWGVACGCELTAARPQHKTRAADVMYQTLKRRIKQVLQVCVCRMACLPDFECLPPIARSGVTITQLLSFRYHTKCTEAPHVGVISTLVFNQNVPESATHILPRAVLRTSYRH
jgi:hypothetical protein